MVFKVRQYCFDGLLSAQYATAPCTNSSPPFLANEFSRPNWQPIVSLFLRINKTLEVILGSGVVALLVYLIYNYVPILDNKRWTAIVILAFLALAAMWLLSAAKRFHRSTLAEVYGAQEQTSRDLVVS